MTADRNAFLGFLAGLALAFFALLLYREYEERHRPAPAPRLACSNDTCVGICCHSVLDGQHAKDLCKCTRRCPHCR